MALGVIGKPLGQRIWNENPPGGDNPWDLLFSSSMASSDTLGQAAARKLEILFSWSLARGGENWRLQSIHCNIAQLTTWGVNVHARVLSIRFCAVQNGAKDLFVLFWKSSVQKKGSCLVYIDRAKQIKLMSKAKLCIFSREQNV